MNKTLLNKIIKPVDFYHLSSNRAIDIFFNIKYKGYYLRSQLATFFDWFYDLEHGGELISTGCYYFFFFVLVNENYQKKMEDVIYPYRLGVFKGNTIAEVTNGKVIRDLYNYEDPDKDPKLIIHDDISKRITSIPFTANDLIIKENPYLNKLIELKKDIILLDMDLILTKVDKHPTKIKTGLTYPLKIYSLPAFNYSNYYEDLIKERKYRDEILYPYSNHDFIKNLYDIVCMYMDYDYFLTRRDFLIILRHIGNLSWEWIKEKKVTEKYLKELNIVQARMSNRDFPIIDFCSKFLDELITDLLTEKQILICNFCHDFIRYHKGKKYCSLSSEGKDCGTKARNHEHYKRHQEEIKTKARKLW